MKTIQTQININAKPEKVWSILIDFEKYPQWNPFIKSAKGKVEIGAKLIIKISPPNNKDMTFKPVMQSVTKDKEFSWLGHFLFPGIFDGNHIFIIESTPSGCLLIQKENFSGLLVPLFWKNINKNTRFGFEQMNQALKERAENKSI